MDYHTCPCFCTPPLPLAQFRANKGKTNSHSLPGICSQKLTEQQGNYHESMPNGIPRFQTELWARFPSEKYICPVHCECALVQYLGEGRDVLWGDVPAFSYVGILKLSCGACRIWLEAFNRSGRQRFYTRDCHGKWY